MATARLTTFGHAGERPPSGGWFLHVVGHVRRRRGALAGTSAAAGSFEYAAVLIGTLGVVLGHVVAGAADLRPLPGLSPVHRPAGLTSPGRTDQSEQFRQYVPLRITVPEVLAEPFRVLHARVLPLRGSPVLHRLHEVVDAVVLAGQARWLSWHSSMRAFSSMTLEMSIGRPDAIGAPNASFPSRGSQ